MANGAVGAALSTLGRRIGTGGPALLGAIEKRQSAAREAEQLSQILRSFEEAPVSAIEGVAGITPAAPEIPEENPQIAVLKNEITKLDEDDAKINNKINRANQVLTGKVSENTRKIINERRKEFQRQLKNNASSKLRLTTQLGVEAQREATRAASATRLSESQEQTRRKTAERTNLNDFTTQAINLPLAEARQLFTQIGSKPDGFGDKTGVANQFLRMLESRDKELKAASEDEIRKLERFIDNTRRSLAKPANFRKLSASKGFRKQLRDFTIKFGTFGEAIADIVDPKTKLDPEAIENLRVSLNNATQLLAKLRGGQFKFDVITGGTDQLNGKSGNRTLVQAGVPQSLIPQTKSLISQFPNQRDFILKKIKANSNNPRIIQIIESTLREAR